MLDFGFRLRGCRVASGSSPQILVLAARVIWTYIYIYVEKDLVSLYWHLGLSSLAVAENINLLPCVERLAKAGACLQERDHEVPAWAKLGDRLYK